MEMYMSNRKNRESESPACKRPVKEIRYFHEEWPKEEEILAIGLKMSKLHKAERNNLNIAQTDVKGNR
jgi:hypothetical protein